MHEWHWVCHGSYHGNWNSGTDAADWRDAQDQSEGSSAKALVYDFQEWVVLVRVTQNQSNKILPWLTHDLKWIFRTDSPIDIVPYCMACRYVNRYDQRNRNDIDLYTMTRSERPSKNPKVWWCAKFTHTHTHTHTPLDVPDAYTYGCGWSMYLLLWDNMNCHPCTCCHASKASKFKDSVDLVFKKKTYQVYFISI